MSKASVFFDVSPHLDVEYQNNRMFCLRVTGNENSLREIQKRTLVPDHCTSSSFERNCLAIFNPTLDVLLALIRADLKKVDHYKLRMFSRELIRVVHGDQVVESIMPSHLLAYLEQGWRNGHFYMVSKKVLSAYKQTMVERS